MLLAFMWALFRSVVRWLGRYRVRAPHDLDQASFPENVAAMEHAVVAHAHLEHGLHLRAISSSRIRRAASRYADHLEASCSRASLWLLEWACPSIQRLGRESVLKAIQPAASRESWDELLTSEFHGDRVTKGPLSLRAYGLGLFSGFVRRLRLFRVRPPQVNLANQLSFENQDASDYVSFGVLRPQPQAGLLLGLGQRCAQNWFAVGQPWIIENPSGRVRFHGFHFAPARARRQPPEVLERPFKRQNVSFGSESCPQF